MATLRELYSTKQQSLRKSVWNLLKTSQFLMESLFGKPSLKWNGWSGRLIVVKPNSLIVILSVKFDFKNHYYKPESQCALGQSCY